MISGGLAYFRRSKPTTWIVTLPSSCDSSFVTRILAASDYSLVKEHPGRRSPFRFVTFDLRRWCRLGRTS